MKTLSPGFLLISALCSAGLSQTVPTLSIEVQTNALVRFSWPQSANNFVLEELETFSSSNLWSVRPEAPVVSGGYFSVCLGATNTARFYRLRQLSGGGLPPDPGTVAPALSAGSVSDLGNATSFLYSGSDPIQTGVTNGTIELRRAAVLRGIIREANGGPLSGATVSVLNHAEFGQTLTRADGGFDLAVNGGSPLTIHCAKNGYLSAQRLVSVPWQDYVPVPDIVLTPVDPVVTSVALGSNAPAQIARGSVQTDAEGARQATVVLPAGVGATLVLPNGTTQTVAALSLRATEFTVGDKGPSKMPAELPPTSGYTYCVELSADEAVAADARTIQFSQPVQFYVENFLNMPVGIAVPVAYYDKTSGAWVPSNDGRVIKILSVNAGLAELDVNGSNQPANASALAALGINDSERAKLAATYLPGTSLWRANVTHFTPYDLNYGVVPRGGASEPKNPPPRPTDLTDSDNSSKQDGFGSLELQNQVFRESAMLVGTPFALHYSSERAPGRTVENTVTIPLSGTSVPSVLKRIDLEIEVAGRRFTHSFAPQTNLSHTFTWDGADAYGRKLLGAQQARIRIGYAYDGFYALPPAMARSFGAVSGQKIPGDVPARNDAMLWQEHTVELGHWTAEGQGLGGWTFSAHHVYDPQSRVLYYGDGRRRGAQSVNNVVTTTAGTGVSGYSGDGGPATNAKIAYIAGVSVGPDGSLYIAEGNNRIRRVAPDGIITTVAGNGSTTSSGNGGYATNAGVPATVHACVGPDGSLFIAEKAGRVRRVAPDGIITTFAGTGSIGFSGDGGPATQARLNQILEVATGPDGAVYIADWLNHCVRRVGPDGFITTVAGRGGVSGFSGDGGPATQALMKNVGSVSVAPDGSLYIADTGNSRVRRVGTDGIIRTVAGNGQSAFSGDGGFATNAALHNLVATTVALDGTLYIAEYTGKRIRRVGTDGIITSIAGSGASGATGDGGASLQAAFGQPDGVAVGPDGSIYVPDATNFKIRKIAPPLPGFNAGEIAIPSEDGSQLYQFTANGRHLRTLDTLTGMTRFEFNYGANDRLTSIADSDGQVTVLERDARGIVTAVISPHGRRTAVEVNSDGNLASLTSSTNGSMRFAYATGGLLTQVTLPPSNSYHFTYDAVGRLTQAQDPAGGTSDLTRTETASGLEVRRRRASGQITQYSVVRPSNGGQVRTTQFADGTRLEANRDPSGTSTFQQPNGCLVTVRLGPDPRFAMLAPLPVSRTVATPSGLKTSMTAGRATTFSEPGNPLALASLVDTLTINGRSYTNTYSGANRAITNQTPAGRQSVTLLDARGRPIQRLPYGLTPSRVEYNAQGNVSLIVRGLGAEARTNRFTYDVSDRLTSITDAIGRSIQYTHDAPGQATEVLLPGARVLRYAYDSVGNLLSFTPPGRPAHGYTYSAVNLMSAYTPPDVGTGPTGTSYEFNVERKLARITFPNSEAVQFLYNHAGQRSAVTNPLGRITYSYDLVTGNLTNLTGQDDSTVVSFAYDGPLPTRTTWAGPVQGTINRAFDNDLRLMRLSVNESNVVQFHYDADGLLIAAGELAMIRNESGLITRTTLTNVADGRTYDSFGELLTYEARFSGSPLFAIAITRDKLGRVVESRETVGGVTRVIAYDYDVTGGLAQVQENGIVTATYAYDSNGNRVRYTAPGLLQTNVFDAQDRLLRQGETDFSYTAKGDLLTRTSSGQATQYQHDLLGNLRRVIQPQGDQIDYVVDGANRRIGKKVNGTLMRGWLYRDGLRPIAELDGNNRVVSLFVYGSQPHVPDYVVKNSVVYRVLTDHLGSVRLLVNAQTGEIVQQMNYDAFGRVLGDTAPGFQPFGFAGGLYDPDTQLTRFGLRDYDAETGRWTAKDPYGFDGDPSNVYRYVLNDPVNAIDPSGALQTKPEIIRETLWALANEEQRIGGWSNMKASYGEVDITEHALFGDPSMKHYPSPWPWDPKPYERIMGSGGRFLPQRDHNIKAEKLEEFGLNEGELDLRWFVHGYLSSTPMYYAKYGTGVAYNAATKRGFSSEGATTNMKSLRLGQELRKEGFDLADFAEMISGGPPSGTSYQQSSMFPPD